MAHFVAWRGANTDQGSPSISKSIKHVGVGSAFRFGIWGGSTLAVGPNDRSMAEISPRASVESASNNITWYELVGLRAGNVMIEARHSGDNSVWDYFQLAIDKPAAKHRQPIKGVNFNYYVETKGINSNWNASIILTLPIALIPVKGGISVTDSNGSAYNSFSWGRREWDKWAATFVKVIQNAWSEKFWLATPAALTELEVPKPGGGKARVNLHCVLKVALVPAAQATHKMQVVKAKVANGIVFRSDSTKFDDMDLTTVAPSVSGWTSPFNTAVHEIGHTLGLHHPFEKTSPTTPYCVGTHPDCNEIMGLGNQLRPKYATPWQQAAATWFNSNAPGRGFKASDFTASTTRLPPQSI